MSHYPGLLPSVSAPRRLYWVCVPKTEGTAMQDIVKPVGIDHVTCRICLKEVPPSGACSAEASDYVLYFCGIECYRLWRSKAGHDG